MTTAALDCYMEGMRFAARMREAGFMLFDSTGAEAVALLPRVPEVPGVDRDVQALGLALMQSFDLLPEAGRLLLAPALPYEDAQSIDAHGGRLYYTHAVGKGVPSALAYFFERADARRTRCSPAPQLVLYTEPDTNGPDAYA